MKTEKGAAVVQWDAKGAAGFMVKWYWEEERTSRLRAEKHRTTIVEPRTEDRNDPRLGSGEEASTDPVKRTRLQLRRPEQRRQNMPT